MIKKYFLACLFFCLSFQIVWADPSLDTAGRIDWIKSQLRQAEASSRIYQYGWLTVYGAMTGFYSAQAVALDKDDEEHDRFDASVNAVTSGIGVLSVLLDPLPTRQTETKFCDLSLPESGEEDKGADLVALETCLEKVAKRQKRGRSWQTHALAGLLSVAAGVAVACDGSREEDGLFMFAGSILISEIQIFTQPTQAIRAWEAYQNEAWDHAQNDLHARRFFVSVSPVGVSFSYLF